MAIHKVIEILAYSNKSWEDATQNAVNEVAKTIHNIESVYIQEHSVKVESNKIYQYRINAKITFSID